VRCSNSDSAVHSHVNIPTRLHVTSSTGQEQWPQCLILACVSRANAMAIAVKMLCQNLLQPEWCLLSQESTASVGVKQA